MNVPPADVDREIERSLQPINVFPITVPPLRARHDDIPLLVWTFVRRFVQAQGKTIEQIPKRTMDALRRYGWPGNVRELRNIIERGTILSPGPALHVELPTARGPTVSTGMTLEAVEEPTRVSGGCLACRAYQDIEDLGVLASSRSGADRTLSSATCIPRTRGNTSP